MRFCGDCGSPLAAAPKPAAPTAERRQLTVLFCDIVGSTSLSERLDPEDLREILNRYQQVAVDAVTRHRGTVGKYLGDGLLVYFGFPAAGEDDAARGVRAALEMADRVRELAEQIRRERGVELRIRVGIHTGLVIAGEIGAVGQRVVDIVGETPNIAARLQDLAAPDTVVISADTHRLVGRYFRTVSLGDRTLKGLSRPMEVFTVEGESGARNRLEGVRLNPLVGREAEMASLRRLWQCATEGAAQAVLLSGEAGIGKSRLTIGLEDEVGEAAHVVAMAAYAHGANSAFAPVLEFLRSRMGMEGGDRDETRLAKIEGYLAAVEYDDPDALPLLADLLSVAHDHPLAMSPEMQKGRTEELLLDMLAARSAAKPVLMTVEDLHWADPSTLRLMGLQLERPEPGRVLTVFTARPEFVPPWPLGDRFSRIDLHRLDASGTSQLVREVTGGADLPAEIMAQILEKTEGVPLYVEELVAMVVESGALHPALRALGEAASPLSIPATLQDSLMARLDRLNPTKDVVQFASLLGRSFSRRLLALVCGQSEAALSLNLGGVVESDILHPDGDGYRFKHALIQDAAYESMLRSTRQERHLRVARTLQAHFPEIDEQEPELVARHLFEGGERDAAVGYWERAGSRAVRRAANQEAVGHFRQALDALALVPESPERLLRELGLQTGLGPALMSTRGFASPEVEQAYARAREICRVLGDGERLLPVLWGLWAFYFVKGDLIPALELARQVHGMATASPDPLHHRLACHALGYTRFFQGDYAGALDHAQGGLVLDDLAAEREAALAFSMSSVVVCRLFGADALWMLGREAEADATMASAIGLARELDYAPCLMYALATSMFVLHLRGDTDAILAQTAENLPMAGANGAFLWLAVSKMFRGWALAESGDEAGDALFEEGCAMYRATGTSLVQSQVGLLSAEQDWRRGRVASALEHIEEGLAHGARTSERYVEAELHRLRGRILATEATSERGALAQALSRQAEASLRRAVEVARSQGSPPLEARAQASLDAFLAK